MENKLKINYIAVNSLSAISSYGEVFTVGEQVLHQDKKAGKARIRFFEVDMIRNEIKVHTDEGWAHLDFIEKLSNESTNNSPVDAGKRLHGSSEGQLQGNGEVQSGDEGKERGNSDAEQSSGDGQRPDRYDEAYRQLD